MKTLFILLTVQIILLMLNTFWLWLNPGFLAGVGFGSSVVFVCHSIVRTYQLWRLDKWNRERQRGQEQMWKRHRENMERIQREYQEQSQRQERQEQCNREEFQQYQSGTF